ncbi:large-conductance mechanosensitive channel protein MscL [Candidatus Saccharibacteria bacterium]|nr:large-conductance mechanosensitive channel protein MscL [Candidatus Saccharibacteria bacterium]
MDKEEIKKRLDKQRAKQTATVKKVKNNKFLNEFKEFINRGSVIDLAVGIVVGGAFTSIVNSLVNDILMPLIGIVLGGIDFSTLSITVPNIMDEGSSVTLAYGNFIQAIINFLIIAFSIFILIRFINRTKNAVVKKKEEAEEKREKEELVLLREIAEELKKANKK